MVDKFTLFTTAAVKESTLKSFSQTGRTVWVVIATLAFGIGLDS